MHVLSFARQLIATSEKNHSICVHALEIPISAEMFKTDKISTKGRNLEPVHTYILYLSRLKRAAEG